MPRVDAILRHPLFAEYLAGLEAFERDRVFCRHGIAHLLDVARIMWIEVLEHELDLSREVVYATALLHDVGRAEQYATGEPHELAGARIAGEILDGLPGDVAFDADDRTAVLAAIRSHRRPKENPSVLEDLLYRADKASRACFSCAAREACRWSDDKKNLHVRI